MPLNPDDIARELMNRGIDPAEISRINPSLGRQAQAGLIAPRLVAPDKIAERGAYIRDYDKMSKNREDLGRVYPMTADLERFEALNRGQPTGGIQHQDYDGWERLNPLNWPGMVGSVPAKMDPEFKEMSGIASGLQGKARPVGSGATSDFEQRLYRMGVPSPEKEGPTNSSIIAYQKGVMAEEDDRLAFQEEFLRRNGSLSGSQQAWSRYVRDNPYTITADGGRSALNPNRADWKEHFGITPPRPAAPSPAAKRKPGWSGELPKAQRNAAIMFKGSKAPSGQRGNPYVPTSAAEFKKLPAGAWVIDDDGTLFQKAKR